jgi:acyl-CoA thioester hydrolase
MSDSMDSSLKKTKSTIVEIPFLVTTYDIDIAGHLNNIVYVRWLEDLRRRIFDKYYPIEKLLNKDLYPVVVSTNIKYKKQIKLFDEPGGFMWLNNINRIFLQLSAKFFVKEQLAATAEQSCVIINLETNKMVKPPDEILYTFNQENLF